MSFAGVLVYYWLSIMNPHKLVYGGTSIRWTLIVSVLMLIAVIFSKDKLKIKPNSVFVFVILFYLWTCVTTIFAVFPNATELLIEFSKTILVFVLTIMLTNTKDRLNVLIWVFVISGSVYILREGAYLILTGGKHLISGPLKSPYYGNNDLARLFGMVFPFLLFLAFHSKNSLTRKVIWGLILFAVIGVIGSQSRGALMAFIALCGFMFLKSKRKFMLSMIIVILSGLFVTLISDDSMDSYTQRYSTIDDYEEDKSFQGRVFAWNYGYETALQNPILGQGFGAYQGASMVYDGEGRKLKGEKKAFIDAHSIYFEAMGEHGFVGFILFIFAGVAAFFKARSIEMQAAKSMQTYWERDLAIVIQSALIFYFVGGIVISHTYVDYYYLVLAFVIVLDIVFKQQTVDSGEPKEALKDGRLLI